MPERERAHLGFVDARLAYDFFNGAKRVFLVGVPAHQTRDDLIAERCLASIQNHDWNMHFFIVRREQGEPAFFNKRADEGFARARDDCCHLAGRSRRHCSSRVAIFARGSDLHDVAMECVTRPFGRDEQVLLLAFHGEKADAPAGHRYRAFVYRVRRHFLIL